MYNIGGGNIMIRKQIYITEKQDELYKQFSAREGLSVSELMRRALDDYLGNKTSYWGNHNTKVVKEYANKSDN